MGLDHDHAVVGGWRESTGSLVWRDANGELHREDGPAIIRDRGPEEWWVHGQRSRTDGPAVSWPDGSQEWWLHGRRHRAEGPAVIWEDGKQEWHVRGHDITVEVEEWMRSCGITIPFTKEQQAEFLLRWL